MGGAVLLLLTGLALASGTGLLASSSLVPLDLIHYFHPLSRDEARVLPGVVERCEVVGGGGGCGEVGRRKRETIDPEDVEDQSEEVVMKVINQKEQEVNAEVNTFHISKKFVDEAGVMQEEMCLFIRTRAEFIINFETRADAPVSVAGNSYVMPNKPSQPDKVNGTCALETETSMIFIFWSGFNFTIEFTKNPEGNSYYMNRAILIYDTNHPELKKDFEFAKYQGKVHLETRPGKNFFFTPLGKAYLCYKKQNQGPLKLWNVAKEQIEGELSFSDTKFQPFVVRAHGEWGPTKRCLPLEIRLMREDFWPFVSACAVIFFSCLLVGLYAVKRTWFTEQKVDYGAYEAPAAQDMEMVRQPEAQPARQEQPAEEELAQPTKPSANPFQANQANPFH